MRAGRHDLRLPLACLATGALAIGYLGLHLLANAPAGLPLGFSQLAGISLPWTVAWFAFGGSCALTREEGALLGTLSAWSRLTGRAALWVGIPLWGLWYLQLLALG